MKTILTKSPTDAAEIIKRGGIVAFPTETVYGLGANVFDEAAVAKIFDAKRRPSDNPLIAHIADLSQINLLTNEVKECAERFIKVFFPGPLTVVLKKSESVPFIATAGLETIGVRMPKLGVANQFLTACGVPVAAPSANLSGRPSPTTWQAVYEDLNGRIDCILQDEPTEIGLESTVINCTTGVPQVLRAGSISLKQLQTVVPDTKPYQTDLNEKPRSPGLKHKHYSPNATVVIVDQMTSIPGSPHGAYLGINRRRETFRINKICDSVLDYAHSLYEFFRECDRIGVDTIYCESVQEAEIGTALMDRLRRASEK